MTNDYDSIRPYFEHEMPAAMQRIVDDKYFPDLAKYVFPDKTLEEVKAIVLSVKTADDFQILAMSNLVQSVIRNSVSEFSYDGIENISKEKAHLFVSNHRDIMLDSAFLQQVLHWNDFKTTRITFGDNLMISQLAIDIGKSNKMFTVKRGGSMRDFYNNSLELSSFIRQSITVEKESIWIAQRNGRTKDGNDETDQGVIKMFCMSEPKCPKSIEELNIIPIAVSYEIESCDVLKTREIYMSRFGKYEKQKGEDLTSILTGVNQSKGKVHISICEPITIDELECVDQQNEVAFHQSAARLIDKHIYMKYKLMSNNFIAHDLRSQTSTYQSHYSEQEKAFFQKMLDNALNSIEGEKDVIRDIYLGIYANPVDNVLKVIGI